MCLLLSRRAVLRDCVQRLGVYIRHGHGSRCTVSGRLFSIYSSSLSLPFSLSFPHSYYTHTSALNLTVDDCEIKSLSLSPNGKLLAMGAVDKKIRVRVA